MILTYDPTLEQQDLIFNALRFSVLRYSPWASEIAQKIAIPFSMSVFRLRSEARISVTVRKNPEEELLLSEEDIQPDVEWFENFRLRYTDWKKAWWREILQNSVDTCLEALDNYGRRGKIICELYSYTDSDAVVIKVSDNGMGMTLKLLKDAFLKSGGSGK